LFQYIYIVKEARSWHPHLAHHLNFIVRFDIKWNIAIFSFKQRGTPSQKRAKAVNLLCLT